MIEPDKNNEKTNLSPTDEIELKEIFHILWEGKWIISMISTLFAVASVLYALSLPNEYRSTAILAPASQAGNNGLSGLASQFGGLASFAGLNLGASGNDNAKIALEIATTWGFLEKFIRKQNLDVQLLAVKKWDKLNNLLIIDEELYDVNSKKWVRDFDASKGQKPEPSSWELYEALKDRISISQDKKTNFVTLSVEYYSPIVAKEWVEALVLMLNNHVKERDKYEAQKNIKYLKSQIEQTKLSEMQTVFYKLIEEQTKTLMLAELSEEYVFKLISEPKVAELKSKPNRALICIIGTLIGGILSIICAFVARNKIT